MADYNEKLEFILDNGLECRCCPLHRECDGKVKHTPSGPVLPACANVDYKDLLEPKRVERLYHDVHVKGG